jgi:hypothetical protein
MSDQVASTATAAPAPVVTDSAPIAAAVTSAPTQVSELAQAAADHIASVRANAGPKAAAATGTNLSPAMALLEGKAPTVETPAAPAEAPAVEAKPAVEKPPEDAVAANIAKYLRQERLASQERKAIAAERETIKAQTVAIESERANRAKEQDLRELAKRDPVAATKALLGDETLRGTFVVDLINKLSADDSGVVPQITEEQRSELITKQAEERVMAKLKAEEAERVKKAEEETNAKNAQGKEAFFVGLGQQFQLESDKYPFLAAEGVPTREMDAWIESQFNATRKIPAPAAIFEHFDKVQEARAQRFIAAHQKRASVATAPASLPSERPAPSTLATNDTRGKPLRSAEPGETLKQQRERIAASLDHR